MGAWLGTPTGPQRSVIAPLRDERDEIVLDRLLARQFVQFAVRRAVLGGRVGEQRDAARAPRPPSTSAAARLRAARRVQPNTPGAAEHAQDRRREERVARVDRQPGAWRMRRTRRPRATPATAPDERRGGAATAATAPRRAPRPTSTGGRRISPIRRGMYSGTLPIPVTRSSVVGGVAGVRERPQRIAGDQPGR